MLSLILNLDMFNFILCSQTVVLVIMAVEVIVVFIRQSQHFRVTRAIRPIFLLDSYYCRGTRRFVWLSGVWGQVTIYFLIVQYA